MKIAVTGNCQSRPIGIGLKTILPEADIKIFSYVHIMDELEVKELHEYLGKVDVLLTTWVSEEYRDSIGLGTKTLASYLSKNAVCISIPNIHWEGYFPTFGYLKDKTGCVVSPRDEKYREFDKALGDYHDFLVLAGKYMGLTPNELLSNIKNLKFQKQILDKSNESFEALEAREKFCTIKISDYIKENYAQNILFYSFNHPSNLVLCEMINRIILALSLNKIKNCLMLQDKEYLGALRLPIYGFVSKSLEMKTTREYVIQEGTEIALLEIINTFYKCFDFFPDLIEYNKQNPKFSLCEQLLRESL